MTEEKNELVVSDSNELKVGLFEGESNQKRMTSLDLENEDNVDMLLNSMEDVDFKLNDCVGREIECVGCYVIERPIDTYNEETGETITRKKHTLMLFDKEGKSYVTGSNACYMSFSNICTLKGLPTVENPLILKPIKVDGKEKGHSYLKLKICKELSKKI